MRSLLIIFFSLIIPPSKHVKLYLKILKRKIFRTFQRCGISNALFEEEPSPSPPNACIICVCVFYYDSFLIQVPTLSIDPRGECFSFYSCVRGQLIFVFCVIKETYVKMMRKFNLLIFSLLASVCYAFVNNKP